MNNETTKVTAQHDSKSDAALRRAHHEEPPAVPHCIASSII
jgi:hypothetical protein